jgi:hypothetical protein
MKNLFNNLYFFVLFLFFNAVGYAQLYPVQLTPVFNSPYSVKISDYATSMDTKMQLLINPTDISISQRRVRLKLYIQGNGLNIQTSDYAQEQRPIYINGGELQTLTNVDIASLFRLENLQGISATQYANPLPEGMYNFCFEMYDFVTNQKISQKSCASLYLILNDPPLLNTPQKNEQIASTEFPNILFTWTPRQINATNVSYKFELKQLLDPTLDPQIGFQMSPTLYEETLFSTAVLYNLSMPILTPGLRYAWRVRAISTTGLSENAVFKNDGYSEIYSFKYTASCTAPTFLLSESQSSKSVKITWEGVPEHTRYQVQYKKQGVRNAQWFSSNSLNRQSLITNLEPGVTYEFRVGSSCDPAEDGVQSFTYSNISTFTTPTESNGVPAYNCGIVPQINIQNQKPLTNLIQSETFRAGDFPVTILELRGENSPYSGLGYIIVPYLADTKIAVEFKDIVINTDYQLISGVVETSYNPDWKNVTDIEDFTGEGKGGQIEEKVPFIIKDIVINANGDIVVNGVDGEQITIPGGKDTVITDSGGLDANGKAIPPKVYNVDSGGNGSNEGVPVAKGGKPSPENTDGVDKSGQATAFTAKGISIAFSGNGSKYAFDVMPEGASAALKKLYAKAGDNVLPYKAVLNGDSDTMLATVTLTDAKINLDSIVFKTQNGAKIDFTRNDKIFVLTVKGSLTYAEEQILAIVKQGEKWQVIGAFMLVHISPKDINVALVPTDDVSADKLNVIIAETQRIYSKIGVKINFKKEAVLSIDKIVSGNVIQTDKNTITSTYSAEQLKINASYQGSRDGYVLFITNKISSTKQDGYMRLNGQFGYVFAKANNGKENLATAAHELGHGIFKLEHPFEQYKTAEGSTSFLMDYSTTSTLLNHLDWKQINDPAFKLYAFQSQSSGEKVDKEFVLKEDGYFLTPANKLIKLSKGTEIIFTCDQPQSINNGALFSFKTPDGVYWHSTLNPNKGVTETSFKGYFKATAEGWDKDKKTGNLISYSDSNFKYNSAGKYAVYIINMLSIDNQKKEYRILKQEMQLIAQQISTTNSFIGNITKLSYEGNNGLVETISSTGCSTKPGEENNDNIADISYKDYLAGLGKAANKGYREDLVEVNASESHLYDYSGVISAKEKLKVFAQIQNISDTSGLVAKIFITDAQTLPTKKKEVTDYLAKLSGSQIAVWVDFDSSGKATVKTILGNSVSGSGNKDVNKFLALLSEVIPKFDGTYTYFNPLTAILDGVASIVTKAKIPERFFNPEITTKDYNPVLFYVSLVDPFAWSLLINDQVLAEWNISISNSKEVSMNHIYFAFKCGIWNGFVDQVKGLAEMAAIVTNIIDGGERAGEMWEGLKKLGIFCTSTTKDEVCIWSLIKKSHTGQSCQIAETVGYDVANIITIAASFTKAGKIAQISQVMESLDVINLIMKGAGKFINVTVKTTGTVIKFSYTVTKAFIKPGFKIVKGGVPYCVVFPIIIDLTENVDNAVNKARELLKKAELDGQLTIVTPADMDGNVIAEIVVNGEKTKVLLNESEEKLRKSVGELIEEASETLLARLKKLGLTEDEINNVLDKIGNSLDNTNKLTNILEKAPFKDDLAKLKDFLNDITQSADLQDLIREGKDFSKEWYLLKKAGRDSKLLRSRATIESISEIINDASMRKILGSEMDDIMEKFITAHKDSGWGWNKFSLQEHMRMLKVIANKYEGVQGFNKSLRDALNNPNPSMQDGLWHMMKDLEKRGIPREKIKAFDLEFDADDLPCLKCKFDVELNGTGNELKYLEYKSYKNPSKISKPQFLNYISMVDNLEQLQYVFNKSKLSLDEIKASMKDFLLNNSDSMFKPVSQGGIGKDKIKQLFEFGNFKFDNVTEFKNLLNKNESFRDNALKFVKTN